MDVKFAFEITEYVVIALLSTVAIGYTLLQYEPSHPKVVEFVFSIFLLIVVFSIVSFGVNTISTGKIGNIEILFVIGAIFWLLSISGYVLYTGYQLFYGPGPAL